MTLVVGITGGIGSGKSALTARLEAHGVVVVDADLAARVVVEPGTAALEAIADHFGSAMLQPDGGLDRAALRARVFAEPAERAWLERLTHPLIGEEIMRQLGAATSPYVVLSSPLLFETSQKDLAQCTVLVDVPVEVQVTRTIARDDNSEEQVRRIIAAQMPREEKLAMADIVIDNSGSFAALQERADELHSQLLARAEQR